MISTRHEIIHLTHTLSLFYYREQLHPLEATFWELRVGKCEGDGGACTLTRTLSRTLRICVVFKGYF